MRLSDAEWIVMNAIWDRPVESSVRDVLETVEPKTGWAYQTVQTILLRLSQKGALTSRMRANTRLYKATVSRAEAQKTALRSLLQKAFGGAPSSLVQTLLQDEKLSKAEREQLQQLLRAELRV
ncbi:MAG: hypothetical protein Kow001_08990 [Acidobacteriota bacterium]